MKRISVVFGTRPEAIKLAPVVLALKREPDLDCRVCVTAQHRQMLDQVLGTFSIVPDADLNVMQANQSLADLTASLLSSINAYLLKERPDLVMVQGDTTTVLCATLAAFYQHVPVAHVEAGLRTWDLQSPWPEEANRLLASRLASLHFCPTATNRNNLLREGISPERILVTGNTIIDALFLSRSKIRLNMPVIAGLPESLQPACASPPAPRVVLITGHRRESFGVGLENICKAIRELADMFPEIHFVYPVHLNPNVREPVTRLLGDGIPNVHLIEPLDYLPFIVLMSRCHIILTDSGGVQEEAPSLGKPVLVMRSTTERPEAVDAGTVKLVGNDRKQIVASTVQLLTDQAMYYKMARVSNPYGDGMASRRIVAACRKHLCFGVTDEAPPL